MDKRILEALQMQPLSEEEMAARHILGRLYGPIATCTESTRNGRLYNKPLWEKALKDNIFLEKVATKALFLELGHPADREETDMKQACACIPEVPKIVGDDLYAYVDILDTPNGRLLKTLVDYGFVPGISSRGSGDIIGDNQVDPETFFLETWDIVQLPAVKKARLNVCESLDSNSIKLKKALAESYKAAKEEDKDTMKKALGNLNIDINSELVEEVAAKASTEELEEATKEIPWDPETDEVLMEETQSDESEDEEDILDDAAFASFMQEELTEDADEDLSEETPEKAIDADEADEAGEAEETEESDEESDEEAEVEAEDAEDAEEQVEIITGDKATKVKYIVDDIDEEAEIEIAPIVIEGEEHEVKSISAVVEDDKLVISVTCATEEEAADIDKETQIEDEEIPDEDVEMADIDSDSAEDNGDVEVIESLKDMIRQKEALETEVGALRKAKSVGDAKEQELQEKLNQYKKAFRHTSAEAAKVAELQSKINELTEQLAQSQSNTKVLTEKVNSTQQLKESSEQKTAKIRQLNEEVERLTSKSEALEAKLEGQTNQYTKKLQERTELAKRYKMRFIETLTKYVESKASMLGVQPSEITSRLNESYTLEDVDAVCDQILDSAVGFSRLPFGGRGKASVRISESVTKSVAAATKRDPEYGYDIDDSLLELAGLKR